MVYDQTYTNQKLSFSWNNVTGAVQQNGLACSYDTAGGTAYWSNATGGSLYCGNTTSPGPGAVQPGFVTTYNSFKTVYLYMKYNGVSHEIHGMIHAGGSQGSGTSVIFSGAHYGTYNYPLIGYGTVSCTP
jgi:hypothetical protein